MIELIDSVKHTDDPGESEAVTGQTSSGCDAEGLRWAWPIRVGDCRFNIWETKWTTGEHEIVLAREVVQATMPVSVTNLMARRRANVEMVRGIEFMSVRRVDPDVNHWPRFSNCSEEDLQYLVPERSEELLSALGYLGSTSRMDGLGASGRNRHQLIAMFRPDSRAAQVGFYVLTRLVPTFRHAGIL